MEIDASRPVPVYYQLKTLLLEQISAGAYLPGDRLPTEQELCARYGVSRTPVHRALSELADEGVIVRRRRHGTIVNPHWSPVPNEGLLRVLVTSEEWADHVRRTAPEGSELNVAAVGYPNLHRHITLAVAEGQAPDLMLIDSVWVQEFAEAGILAPLDDLAPAWVAAEYGDFVPAFEHHGRPVAVAAEANVAGLWFDRATLSRHGLSPPDTWEALEAVLEQLRAVEPDTVPLAMPLGIMAAETTTYCLVGLLAANGADVVSDHEVVLDSVEAAATLAFLGNLVAQGLVPVEGVAFEWDRAPELVASGQAVMSIGGVYEGPLLANVRSSPLSQLDDTIGFAPLPTGPDGTAATVLGGMAYAVPRQSQHPFAAMSVLRALVSEEAIVDLAVATGTMPGRRSALQSMAQHDARIAVAEDLLQVGRKRPQTVAYNRVSTQLQLMVEAVALGRMEPDVAVARTADHIGAITGLPVRHREVV